MRGPILLAMCCFVYLAMTKGVLFLLVLDDAWHMGEQQFMCGALQSELEAEAQELAALPKTAAARERLREVQRELRQFQDPDAPWWQRILRRT